MWSKVKLEDVAEKIAMGPFGSNLKVETFVNKGVPIISGAHLRGTRVIDAGNNFITESHAQKLLNSNVFQGDVIFTHAGNIGQVAFIPETSKYEKYVISQRQFYLRCNQNKLRPAFITYYFHTYKGRHQLLANTSQVGVPSIARPSSYLKSLQVPLPPLEVQDAIVDLLSVLDDKIENNRRMNETLEEMVRAGFKSWFVDFDPVRAKMEGRPTGFPDDISDLFPNELVDSEIGQIPKGWKVGEFKELCEIQNGYAFKGKDWKEHGTIPVVKIGNVKPMLVDLDNCSLIEENMVKSLGQFELNRGDILIGLTGYVGEVGLVPKRNIMPYLNQRVGKLVPHSSDDFSFIVTHARRSEFKNNVENISTGSAQQNVSPRDIKLLKLTIPPTALRSKFHRLFHSFFEKILICDEQTHTLAELRDTLLPKLISGEIRVADAERKMETAI